MQNSDDDMIDLFRRAAKDIRLVLEDEDWDAIQTRLSSNAPVFINPEKKKANRNTYKLLFIAFWICMLSGTTVFTLLKISNKSTREQRANVFTVSKSVHAEKNTTPGFCKSKNKDSRLTILNGPASLNENKEGLVYFDTHHNKVAHDMPDSGELGIRYSGQTNFDIQAKSLDFVQNQDIIIIKKEIRISNTPEKNTKQDQAANKSKRFYIGLVAGPQYSNIKEQEFSTPGLSAGVLAGFRLNKKLAIETGFFISDKRYYSSGEYFNMSKVSATMPAGMELLSVKSKSTVLEIPIKLKYNWLKIKQGSFFGTAGLSSYILTNESNHYLALFNGNQENLTGNYPEARNYIAATVNLSAGYEFSTRNGIMLRVEPYLQIPLKKIGIGSLPVLSTGLYMGITIPVFK